MKNKLRLKVRHKVLIFRKCLLFLFFLIGLQTLLKAQTRLIKGKVTDEIGMGLPGASVLIQGTSIGTLTDNNGLYQIQVSDTNMLVTSFIGFITNTTIVGNKSEINITLIESANSLDEVVVVGYGEVKKSDLTGSISKLDVDDLQKAPIRSFDEALGGRLAGVQVTSSDGQPGSDINIVIRGNNSVTQSNAPLYVIDGFLIEGSNNNAINPQDIETIQVLKDASATAIYGARGANGVIVITTKKGKKGAPVFSFDASYGFQNNLKKVELLSPYEFVKYQIEFDPTPVSNTPTKSPTQIYLDNGKTLDYYKDIPAKDWEGKITRVAPMQNLNFSVRGGSDKTKYSLSSSFINQDGIIIKSNYKRYQGRFSR